jgi:ParB-like chromosome segregation protein Spo0J
MKIQQLELTRVAVAGWSWSNATPEVLEKMRRSLEQFGQLSPITVFPNPDLDSEVEYEVIDGNVRVKALRNAGISTVWAIIHDEMNRVEALKLALQLNNFNAEKDAVNFSKALYELVKAIGIEYVMTLTTEDKRDVESCVALAAQNFDWYTYEGPRVDPETTLF